MIAKSPIRPHLSVCSSCCSLLWLWKFLAYFVCHLTNFCDVYSLHLYFYFVSYVYLTFFDKLQNFQHLSLRMFVLCFSQNFQHFSIHCLCSFAYRTLYCWNYLEHCCPLCWTIILEVAQFLVNPWTSQQHYLLACSLACFVLILFWSPIWFCMQHHCTCLLYINLICVLFFNLNLSITETVVEILITS